MGRNKYPGVTTGSATSIAISFYYRGQKCRERIKLQPTPANLKRAAHHRAAILLAIENCTFDYSVTFPDSKNVQRFSPSQYTVRTYLTEWLENKKQTIKSSTYADYKKTINNLIITTFGHKLLNHLTRQDVRKWAATFKCSNKRIANILSPLRAALRDAYIDDLIKENPLHGWTYKRNEPPHTESHVDPFAAEEQEAILNATSGQFKNQCIVFFWTGMRTSELIALEWSDIDWKRKKIRINRAYTAAAKSDESTKTKSSTREIDMLPHVENALIDQKQYTLPQRGKVFTHPITGKQWTGDQQIRKGFWIPLLRKAGVRYRNPYQTRHTYASMMLSAGENLAWVSAQMGHSNVLITARIYMRWINNNEQHGNKAVEMFGQHLGNIKN